MIWGRKQSYQTKGQNHDLKKTSLILINIITSPLRFLVLYLTAQIQFFQPHKKILVFIFVPFQSTLMLHNPNVGFFLVGLLVRIHIGSLNYWSCYKESKFKISKQLLSYFWDFTDVPRTSLVKFFFNNVCYCITAVL